MKISNIVRINVNYIRNNFWDVIKMCRLIILSLLLVMITQKITGQFQQELNSKITDDYMIFFNNLSYDLKNKDLMELNASWSEIAHIERLDNESSKDFQTQNGDTIDLDTLNFCEENSFPTVIINTEISKNYNIKKYDRLIKEGVVFHVMDVQEFLWEDKEAIICDRNSVSDMSHNYLLRVSSKENLNQDLQIIKSRLSKKLLLSKNDIIFEKVGSREIISGITSVAKKVIDTMLILVTTFSMLSIIHVLELSKLKRSEEFTILKYNGLFEWEEKLMNFSMMVMLLLFCYIISKILILLLWNMALKHLF